MRFKALFLFLFVTVSLFSQKVVKLGIIGLDTSHSPAFIKLLTEENAAMIVFQTILRSLRSME